MKAKPYRQACTSCRRILGGCLLGLLILGGFWQASASEDFESLVQIVRSGASENVLLAYVNSSPVNYALTVDEILYLSDLGLSAEAITAIHAHHGPDTGVAESSSLPDVAAVLEQAGVASASVAPEIPASDYYAAPPLETVPPVAPEVVQEIVVEPPVVAAPPADTADYSTFYDSLSPYGNWINVDNEWCWQPTAVLVDAAWSPYCQRGRWVYTDCGWAWQSSYSWGWAPFHYGRWAHHSRHGWIWRPDHVWGPAWVCWRSSEAAIGWAPLPPETACDANFGLCYRGRAVSVGFDFGLGWAAFTFVAFEHFCEPGVGRHRFPQCEKIFRVAPIMQNHLAYQQGHIHNSGPEPERITTFTHQEIRPVKIVDQNIRAGEPVSRARLSGSTLAMYRPFVKPTARETPRQVVAQRETLENTRREATRNNDVLHAYREAPVVRGEQVRGLQSRGGQPVGVVPPAISVAPDTRWHEQQRLAEEASARQQEAQRHQAEELIQRQNAERQQAQEQARQRTLAEQQHREADVARQQEEQKRTAEMARQQDAQRQAQETARQQERQREVDAAARVAEEQRQTLRVQREAEESEARRQQETVARVQQENAAATRTREVVRPQPEGLQGYGNPALTGAASSRGYNSRGQ